MDVSYDLCFKTQVLMLSDRLIQNKYFALFNDTLGTCIMQMSHRIFQIIDSAIYIAELYIIETHH